MEEQDFVGDFRFVVDPDSGNGCTCDIDSRKDKLGKQYLVGDAVAA